MGLSHLSLLQMSFSGAVFILVIILLRAVAINRLPKKMFLILWGIALLRLLIPFSVPSVVSVYSVISQTVDDNTLDQTPIRNIIPIVPSEQAELGDYIQTTVQAEPLQQPQQQQLQLPQPSHQSPQSQTQLLQQIQQSGSDELLQSQQASEKTLTVSEWFVVWCAGMILCTVFFTTSYLRWYFKFRTSVPVHNAYVEQWLEEHRLQRSISIRQSDRTAAPLTYGVLRPVILLPNKTDWENTEQLRYILLHEYVHICRFDTVTKFITAIAVCIHWFNPLVWVMYILFNRDLELSCDERVVRLLGIASRSDYARVLISMETKKSGLMPFYNNFSKNAIEERITSIMKTGKTSLLAILAAVIVVGGLTAVFATSAQTAKGESETDTDESFPELTVNRQLLQYIGMTYGQFQEQSGVEAESYHADFFIATIPDMATDVVFEGAYDEELEGPVLADDAKIFRIEGSLNVLISGINEQMTIDELTDTLTRNSDFTYIGHLGVQEGGGTAYYVADYYVEAGVDSNRDGVEDAVLQIALDGKESDTVSPNAYTWLVCEQDASDSQDVANATGNLDVNIQDFYTTNMGDPSNLYYIDENKVLWGCGRNDYGQLGQGTQDYDFHKEMVKIAENVMHVDYSQTGFTIYLTEDHKLYGMGNAGSGALQQYEQFDDTQWLLNGGYDNYAVTTPCLLMENVIYARCGRDDVACLDEDNNVWIWGMIGCDRYPVNEIYFESKPVKVLENAVLITGGLFNHAALLADGSVWTWGYNYVGNCGVSDKIIVEEPMRVAEDAVMVWTETTEYNIDCQDISEFGGVYEQQFENTIILKRDGSYWACGVNVGNEEKVLAQYWETYDYPVVCSSEFLPYENPKVAYNSNNYHSISDVDETSVYLGGAGGIYEINRFAVGTIYSAPHMAGAALYKNYVYSIEYNVTGNGMTAELIRIKKNGSDKEVLTQISAASYDLRIIDNILVISEYNMEDHGPVSLFYAYMLDNGGNLASDTPQDAYARFGLPDGYEDGMHFLINPWFSTQSLGYTCFVKVAGVMDINSIWIMWEGQETAEEVVTCSGQPLLTEDTIFYCDSTGETLIQRSLSNIQETVLYEIPDDTGLTLLTYDSEWVYFLEYSRRLREDDNYESDETIRRVNLQDHSMEEIYVFQSGSYGGNFNVYGNYCYFILSSAVSNRWVRYNMTNGEMTTIPEED